MLGGSAVMEKLSPAAQHAELHHLHQGGVTIYPGLPNLSKLFIGHPGGFLRLNWKNA